MVSRSDASIAEASGILTINSAPGVKPHSAIAAATQPAISTPLPLIRAEKVELRTPSMIDDAVLGGSGKFIFLPLRLINKIAVFDVRQIRIVKYLDAPAANYVLTASADKLFIVVPSEHLIERWSLQTFDRETSTKLPPRLYPSQVATGSSANGPLLLVAKATPDGPLSHFALLDPATLDEIPIDPRAAGGSQFMSEKQHLRAAADGTVFGSWAEVTSPSGLQVLKWVSGTLHSVYEHDSVGFVLPGPDGRYIFTQTHGIYSAKVKQRETGRNNFELTGAVMPSLTPGLYIDIRMTAPPDSRRTKFEGSIHHISVDQRLLELPAMEEMTANINDYNPVADFTLEKRIQFLPADNLLITIPPSNDRLVARKLNFMEAMEKQGKDYLFIISMPPTRCVPDTDYRYQIEAKSRRGGVTFKLESGPPGMTVSSAGLVSWHAPIDATNTVVLISVKDSTGQEIYHTFEIDLK